MLRNKELKWFYQYGASEVYPEAWQGFLKEIPEEKRFDLIEAYRDILMGMTKKKNYLPLKHGQMEASTSYINYNPEAIKESVNSKFALAFALIENHYFVHKGFLDYEDQLLDNIDIIRHIPTVIVQGRYDVVCPPTTAYELHSDGQNQSLK